MISPTRSFPEDYNGTPHRVQGARLHRADSAHHRLAGALDEQPVLLGNLTRQEGGICIAVYAFTPGGASLDGLGWSAPSRAPRRCPHRHRHCRGPSSGAPRPRRQACRGQLYQLSTKSSIARPAHPSRIPRHRDRRLGMVQGILDPPQPRPGRPDQRQIDLEVIGPLLPYRSAAGTLMLRSRSSVTYRVSD